MAKKATATKAAKKTPVKKGPPCNNNNVVDIKQYGLAAISLVAANKAPADRSADTTYKRICEDIEWLRAESVKEMADGSASKAHVLWYALAGFLEERDILDDLKTTAYYMFMNPSGSRG
jgi:hypothetical protein